MDTFVGTIHDKSPPPPPKYPGKRKNAKQQHERPLAESTPLHQNQPQQLNYSQPISILKKQGSEKEMKLTAATSEKYWYKASMSRDHAVQILKGAQPGDFIVRDSKSFQGSYGLCVRVERHQVPRAILEQNSDIDERTHLVRHFLIDGSPRGVKVAGSDQEPVFASLAALIHQHAHTPLSLPIKLNIPSVDYVAAQTTHEQAIGEVHAKCFYLFESDTEMLTNEAAIERCYQDYLNQSTEPKTLCPIQVRANRDGLLLTDANRRLFFRKHYASDQIAHCGYHPSTNRISHQGQQLKMFAVVAKRSHSNTCILLVTDEAGAAESIVGTLLRVIHHALSEQKNGIY